MGVTATTATVRVGAEPEPNSSGNHHITIRGGKMASASSFPDELIIRHVRNHSCLYDPRESEYKDADRKAAVWREIANAVGMSAIECEHRWRYLRDRYTRERKRKSQQTNQTISKAGNWPLAKQMHFIQDFIKHRRLEFRARGQNSNDNAGSAASSTGTTRGGQHGHSNGSDNHNDTPIKVEGDNNCNSPFDQSEYPMVIIEETGGAAHLTADVLHHAGSVPPSVTPPEFRMSNDHRIDRSMYNSGRGASNATSGLGANPHHVVYQEDELFCLSVAQTLKRLPAARRSLVKVQMLQLIHDIEFGHS